MKRIFSKVTSVIMFLFVMLFFSCASTRAVESSTSPVYVTNTKKIYILPPSDIEKPIESMQLLQGKFGEQKFSLLAYIQADESCIDLNLFNDFGTDMGVLFYDGITASFDSAIFPPELKAEYVINDLQCAYYKAEELEKNFSSVGLKFEVEKQDGTQSSATDDSKEEASEAADSDSKGKLDGTKSAVQTDKVAGVSLEIRRIFSGKKLIEEISIGDGEIKIVNYLRGYEYLLISADE